MASVVDALTRVRYVGQDFQTYENELKEFLQLKFPQEFTDTINTNMGLALIQMLAYSSMGLAFYMNRRTTDLYMPVAQSPTSIAHIARMLNYTIEGSSVSSVDLTVTLKKGPYLFPVYIEKGFQFKGPNGLKFEFRDPQPIIFNPGELTKDITVYEGTTKESVFISDGSENQRFKIIGIPAGKSIVGASVEVTVGNESWTEENQIPYVKANVFEVDYVSEPPIIKMGDGIAGAVPDNGKEVRISFIIGSGSAGRVGRNTITKEEHQLVIKNQKIDLTITNPEPSTGGEDREDLRKVKSIAPKFFQSQDRAISKKDYDAISNTYPGVAKADAQIVRGIEDDLTIIGYLNSIQSLVNSGVSGITVETDPMMASIFVHGANIDVLANTFGSNVVAAILAKHSLLHDELNGLKGNVTGIVDTLVSDTNPYFSAIAVDSTNIEDISQLSIDTTSSLIVIKKAAIEAVAAEISTIVAGCSGTIPANVNALLTEITTYVGEIQSDVAATLSLADADITTNTGDIVTKSSNISAKIQTLYTTLPAAIDSTHTNIDSILSDLETIVIGYEATFLAGVDSELLSIESLLNQMNTVYMQHSDGIVSGVEYEISGLYTYLDTTMNASCGANIVQVSLLQVDQNNKYTSPASGMITTLQTHLQNRADAVHVVKVIDGSQQLIECDVEVHIKVNKNAVATSVLTFARDSLTKYDAQPYGLLVLRNYGDSLYKWQINKAVRDAQLNDTDIDYANIFITYPTSKLDASGNLIVKRQEIIIPRTVSIINIAE